MKNKINYIDALTLTSTDGKGTIKMISSDWSDQTQTEMDEEIAVDIANNINAHQLVKIIRIWSERISVFKYSDSSVFDLDENIPVNLNKNSIQININE